MTTFHTFDARPALEQALAAELAARLREGIAVRGAASLVVSGGRTPLGLLARLATEALPWERVWITLADERWVAEDDPASNARLVREALLARPAAAARFISLKTAAATPHAGLAEVAQRLAAVPHPFDAVVLGMGDDGHTASLFPGAPELAAALASPGPCAAMTPTAAPHARITLTPAALLAARALYLHIVGEDKRAVYARAAAPGPVAALPVRVALHQDRVPCAVYWAA